MARRGGLLLWCLGSAFPTSSSCRGLDLLSRILCSRMELHGLSRPGKLLLPGSCLLGPASSSCRGPCLECLVLSWRFLGGPRRRVLQLPVHKSGVLRYPYFSTPTPTSTNKSKFTQAQSSHEKLEHIQITHTGNPR